MKRRERRLGLAVAMTSVTAFLIAMVQAGGSPAMLFLTPDQLGQWRLARGDYHGAAAVFTDPLRRGVAHYRAGDFAAAAAAFAQVTSPEARFNLGNAELMQGHYAAAIAAYQQALAIRRHWPAAQTNLELARLRLARLTPEENRETGNDLPPDEIVFDRNAPRNREPQESAETNTLPGNEQLRAMWLRRVQTRPQDFLRARFAYQASQAAEAPAEEPETTAETSR